MIAPKILLVPIDFQEASLCALAKARELALELGLEIVLFHAYTIPLVAYPGLDPIMVPGLPEEISAAARSRLAAVAGENGGLRTVLVAGDPAEETLRAIEELRPEMVVMGTHGRKGLSRLVLGSVAEKVLRQSEAPVLTIRAPAHK